MGDSISKLFEDYETYELLCKNLNIKKIGIDKNFYNHEEELMKKYGFIRVYYGYKPTKERLRTEKIKKILKNGYNVTKNG